MPMTNDYTIHKDKIPEYPIPLPYNIDLQSNIWI